MAEAKAASNFITSRELKKRWNRYYTNDYDSSDRDADRVNLPPAGTADVADG
jgi:hypothetical protein